jgi:predicted Zn-dependent protease
VAETQDLESRREFYEAYQRNAALAKDFAGLKDVRAFESAAVELKKSRAVRDAINREKAIGERQARLEIQLNVLLARAIAGAEGALQAHELVRTIISLRSQSDQTQNESDRVVARRILSVFWVRLSQESSLDLEKGDYTRAALRMELMTEIRPDSPRVYYNLACAYARSGNKKRALKALDDAVTRGFSNLSKLQKDPDLETIRGDSAFQRILNK